LRLFQCGRSVSRHETYDAIFDEARHQPCRLEDVVNQWDEFGRTPLFLAVKERQHSALLALLDLGADIDAGSNQTGWSPLLMASWIQDNASVEILVAHGASVDHRCSTPCNFTPLSAAAVSKSLAICSVLCAAGANVEYALDLLLASDFAAQEEVAGFIAESAAFVVKASERHGPIIIGKLLEDMDELTVRPSY